MPLSQGDTGIDTDPLPAYGRAAFPGLVIGYAGLGPDRLRDAMSQLRVAVQPHGLGRREAAPSR
ncbi:hypothetical protein [Nonomuraea sp. NPDC003804]|uniref:hypothetical protein n=1 Tax=Nonomuraea sp. NPDC003804 TaxID=3154547 RepID=UPI0033A94811